MFKSPQLAAADRICMISLGGIIASLFMLFTAWLAGMAGLSLEETAQSPAIIAISGFATIFVTAYVVTLQIRHQLAQEENIRKRKERATRSQLPNALSELFGVYHAAISWYLHPSTRARPSWDHAFQSLDVVSQVIEHADDKTAQHLERIIIDFQIVRSRLEEDWRTYQSSTGSSLPNMLADNFICSTFVRWAILGTGVRRAFDYSRGESSIASGAVTVSDIFETIRQNEDFRMFDALAPFIQEQVNQLSLNFLGYEGKQYANWSAVKLSTRRAT